MNPTRKEGTKALDEAGRFRITTKLADTLGQDDAGFSRVDAQFDQVAISFARVDAQFDQVAISFARVDAQFDQVDAKLSDLRTELHKTLRVHFLALMTTMMAMNTMMVSIVALLR
ncbi:MAG: hypothetical protein WCG40_06090 [Actinomycetes bacterium]